MMETLFTPTPTPIVSWDAKQHGWRVTSNDKTLDIICFTRWGANRAAKRWLKNGNY